MACARRVRRVGSPARPPVPALPDRSALYRRARELGRLWQVPDFADRVDIDYSWSMRTRIGYADLIRHRVRLNARLLSAHPDELEDTLVHELAHVAAVLICGLEIAPHGSEWAGLMRLAGLEPERTHDLDVATLAQGRRKYLYLHRCDRCGAFRVSRRVVRNWECGGCGPGELSIWRAPDSSAGRRSLAKITRGKARKEAARAGRA